MSDLKHYVIRGGIEGRERLKMLSRVMHEDTTALFERLAVSDGMKCLDIGCGSGDVTMELARRVGPHGQAVGIDIDGMKVELAAEDAKRRGLSNVGFRRLDIRKATPVSEFDLIYTRFLLTHLSDPAETIAMIYQYLKPWGLLIVEDIDFSGNFVYPDSKAFWRYHELYCAAVRKRGGDPEIGPRLPLLLKQQGFAHLGVKVVQPVGLEGEVKLLNPLTLENIAETVIEEELASREEISAVVQELYEFAADPNTLAGAPRIIQTWGRRPLE